MWHISHLRRYFLTATLVVNFACGGVEEVSTSSEKVIGGTQTLDRPEIGRLHFSNNGLCTGTLVAPNVVITAAHCIDFRSPNDTANTNYGYFVIERSGSPASWFQINAMKSFGRDAGDRDIALLRLDEDVPSNVATPATLANEQIARNSDVTIFGYGCTERERQRGSGIKRAFETRYESTYNLCPGDSGGPVVIGRNGPVLLINSAYYIGSGRDIFAKPFQMRNELLDQIQAWSGVPPPSTSPAPPPPAPSGDDELVNPPAPSECYGGAQQGSAVSIENIDGVSVCQQRDSWIKVELRRGQLFDVRVAFEHSQGDIDISFHNSSGRRFKISQGTSNQERIQYRIWRNGTYYVRIYGYGGAKNTVNISYSR